MLLFAIYVYNNNKIFPNGCLIECKQSLCLSARVCYYVMLLWADWRDQNNKLYAKPDTYNKYISTHSTCMFVKDYMCVL